MHYQIVIRIINPEISASIIAVTHGADDLLRFCFRFFLCQFPCLALIIFCLQHSNHRLDLRLDLCVVTGIHRTFIFRQRHIGRIPDTENGSCPKQQGCQ